MPKLQIDDLIAAVDDVAELQNTVQQQEAALIAIKAELKGLDERLRALESKVRRRRT